MTCTRIDPPATSAGGAERLVELHLSGHVTAPAVAEVREAIRGCAGPGGVRVLVDMESVTAIDATGIAALLDGRRAIESQHGGAMILKLSPVVRRALKDSGTITAFRIRDAM